MKGDEMKGKVGETIAATGFAIFMVCLGVRILLGAF